MRTQTDEAIAPDLVAQIGNYGNDSPTCIGSEGEKELYRGIDNYQEKIHAQLVRSYKKAYTVSSADSDSSFFRRQFIEYIQNHPMPKFDDDPKNDPKKRETNPEQATINMAKLLGKQGAELFQLALEEEMHSKEFRNAVVNKSTTHFEGAKWDERPVVIVSGPSGCGKSYAAQAAVEKANQFLSANPNDMSGNDVVAADGGIAREMSQIRKLTIQVATNQGYTGIKDLSSHSDILEKMKHRVREAAFKTPGVGVVIPETFSKWSVPFHPVRDLMANIDRLKNTKQIFVRVEGHNHDNFEKVVSFMGSRRAWKTKDFHHENLDLNKTGICESKAYKKRGFSWGVLGSLHAETWFKTHSKDKLSMIITNDLILLKPNATKTDWIAAEQGDNGARLFSEQVYKAWKALPNDELKPDLIAYSNEHASTQITTSAQIDFAIDQKDIGQRLTVCTRKIENESAKQPLNQKRLNRLHIRQEFLEDVSRFTLDNFNNLNELLEHRNHVNTYIALIKSNNPNDWQRILNKKVMITMNEYLATLDKGVRELQNAPIYHESTADTAFFRRELSDSRNAIEDSPDDKEREGESNGL